MFPSPSATDPELRRLRHPVDPILALVGLIVLSITAVLARGGVFAWEISVFRAVNELPAALQPIVWLLNQYGTAATIPLAAAASLLFRRWTLAVALGATGVGVYVLAKVVKEYVERGRPGALIEGVYQREAFAAGSFGFPSGHAAVAWAITVVLLPRVGRPWQVAALLMAIVVPFARLYIAAHLPLDLIGGAALGVTAASLANYLIGVRTTRDDGREGPLSERRPRRTPRS